MFFDLDASTLFAHLFVLLIAFTVHEFAHAWTANFFGDLTPKANGRLTLNPLAHLDPIGSLLLLVAGFGWAKPVPVNPYALERKSPAAMMWVSLAGPLSNLVMATLAAIPIRLGWVSSYQAQFDAMTSNHRFWPTLPQLLWVFISINLLLMLFNLIPLAPLDGETIAHYFFPSAWSRALEAIRPYGPLILTVVVFLGVLRWVITPPLNVLMTLLVG
ncbi:MAG: site-2 protease family protein [Anaerolineales bacterium]|nr:site-2 protease family protein [Anaerolineales bacterium]